MLRQICVRLTDIDVVHNGSGISHVNSSDRDFNSPSNVPHTQPSHSTGTLKAFRSCCRRLRDISDEACLFASFDAKDQQMVGSFLLRLPRLVAVSVRYSTSVSDMNSSLTSLHLIKPDLTSLTLICTPYFSPWQSAGAEVMIDSALMSWAGTLQRLCMIDQHNVHFNAKWGTKFAFLAQLSALKDLELENIFPLVTSQILAGCTGLLKLRLSGNLVDRVSQALDLSRCILLRELYCTNYNLKELDVSGLTALWMLNCSRNHLTQLQLSTNTILQELDCSCNSLGSLDVTPCAEIKHVSCGSNLELYSLQVTGCMDMISLSCKNSKIQELDISTCTALQKLDCSETWMADLTLKRRSRLKSINASRCKHLRSLDLAGLHSLETANFEGSSLFKLDFSRCSALKSVACPHNAALRYLVADGCGSLHDLNMEGCLGLQAVSLTGCVSLVSFRCPAACYKSIDLSSCILLKQS